jgi:small subunit ribosomal protein S4e
MAKKGEGKHMKRIAKPKAIPITDKKAFTWIKRTAPGPHPMRSSIPLVVLLRDVLKVAKTAREARSIMVQRLAEVDGVPRAAEDFPVGLMDVVGFPKADKYYRIVVDWKGRLQPMEVKKSDASKKLLRVVGKHVVPGAKISLTFHDGRNMYGDNHVRCGDSILVSLPDAKMVEHLKLAPGSRCLIREGKHAGKVVTLNEIIQRKAGKPAEARVTDEKGKEEFVTVARYLFVVNSGFGVSS